jgi:hypothetical protein
LIDWYNTFGLGENVPIIMGNLNSSIFAFVDGRLLNFVVPYPMGFFAKNVDGRIDDPNAGWKAARFGRRMAAAPISTSRAERRTGRVRSDCKFVPIRLRVNADTAAVGAPVISAALLLPGFLGACAATRTTRPR